MKVSEIMNKALVVDDNITLKQAAKVMSDRNMGSLIVLKKDEIAGIITERDVIRNVPNLDKKISAVMSKKVITIEASDTIDSAAQLMSENNIKKLPVVKKGCLVGIVTSTDIVAHSEDLNEDFLLS